MWRRVSLGEGSTRATTPPCRYKLTARERGVSNLLGRARGGALRFAPACSLQTLGFEMYKITLPLIAFDSPADAGPRNWS